MLSILKNYTILYVEDEPEIQENIVEYLESYFETVHVASDGKEALLMYEKNFPDVLLVDINIPYVDGLTVVSKIREKNQTVKIVMLTAHTEKEKLLRATELKLTKYLVKPITPKHFKEVLALVAEELRLNPQMFISLGEHTFWDRNLELLFKHGTKVLLSEKEHRLFKLLISKKSNLVSYEDIMISVWEDAYDKEISIDSVKNQVRYLRKNLPKGCIDSVYGKGYILK